MTLAPELPGADVLIERLLERGVTVSLGHSDATAEQANAAFDLGRRAPSRTSSTRCGRSCTATPGIVGAALARDDVVVQLILDGVHLAPETVRVVWRAAPGRVALVTDSITAAGRERRRLLASAASTSRCTTARCAGPTACSPAAC